MSRHRAPLFAGIAVLLAAAAACTATTPGRPVAVSRPSAPATSNWEPVSVAVPPPTSEPPPTTEPPPTNGPFTAKDQRSFGRCADGSCEVIVQDGDSFRIRGYYFYVTDFHDQEFQLGFEGDGGFSGYLGCGLGGGGTLSGSDGTLDFSVPSMRGDRAVLRVSHHK